MWWTNKILLISNLHHKKWDEFVMSLSDGLTVLRAGKGEWTSPEGKTHKDRMIPCRIYCNTETIYKIVDFTIEHYNQEAVMAYKLSSHVIIKHNGNKV